MNVVQGWSGTKPAIISLCEKSVAIRESVDRIEFEGGAVESDLARLEHLYEHGGIWLDSDVILLKPLDLIRKRLEECGCVMVKSPASHGWTGILGGIIAAKPNHPAMKHALEYAKTHRNGPYGVTSCGALADAAKNHEVSLMEHWLHFRTPWHNAFKVFAGKRSRGDCEWSKHYVANSVAHHLTHKVVDHFTPFSEADILSGENFTAFLLQKAFDLKPALPARSQFILERFPRDAKIRGAEVGVFRGRNARFILSSRPYLELLMVDPYAQACPRYRATKDHQTGYSKEKWKAIEAEAHRNTAFAGDRAVRMKSRSVEAASEVADQSLDFVFIDADHSYEGAREDILAWHPKIKEGGWIMGHDYNHPREGTRYGVQRAVDELFSSVEVGDDYCWAVKVAGSLVRS